ncbi:2-polyprenyl-6-methoxyphenol hydroxylase-like FAD-dependent oxidoreductase [Arthrobacter sp. V4I6]|uniref:FAD-dependent oxidoreductase n=1 Tax=unclassified Arthrobacter TaxID=235627 RepID=UPI0027895448|nr:MULTISPECIES: NAD(P)/FAD-dependent oxidoreductase [unclassified Arthrobacter]MDQ0821033.1 2-polyprenyl-6-methoxyphenol hydroxylase-like FAD-dependent oxidoreductase [Arthrobacter sp. V1I7]MDQ0855294.1 2-polyprenyl-6-methoxyphenol hydroxylase-like FAD-dependent oxidoreductase [Arthrobacter sp. V4I6]
MPEVLVIGGGPVGLFMAALLLQNGVRVRVLEQRAAPDPHSRAIGIHPPALDVLERIGVAQELVAGGIPIRRGIAVGGGRQLAEMNFDGVSESYPFVLSLPQSRTEAALERRVRALDPGALHRGVGLTGLHDDGAQVTVTGSSPTGPVRYSANLVIAADGVRSTVRTLQGTAVHAKDYPDTYLMGDFADGTCLGPDAALFLASEGIVESFPLPGVQRRWVLRLNGSDRAGSAALHAKTDAGWLAERVRDRTDIHVDAGSNSMLSSFGARSRLARRMVTGRTILIGDAAHEISPIGGQGMNLGWLDAVALAPLVLAAVRGADAGAQLQRFERNRMTAAVRAMRQAEINMALGRPLAGTLLDIRNNAISAAAAVPALNSFVARRFTMQ